MVAKVRDVMTTRVITTEPTTSFKTVAGLFVTHRVGALPVTDPDGRVVGIVSESDLLLKGDRPHATDRFPRRIARRRRVQQAKAGARTAGALMTAPAVTVSPEATVALAARLIRANRVHHLPVVDTAGRLVGIVSRSDLLRVFVRSDETIHRAITEDILAQQLQMNPERVQAEVRDGLVSLRGQVETRSRASTLVRRVEELDGVVGVDAELTWDVDDTTPVGSPPAFPTFSP